MLAPLIYSREMMNREKIVGREGKGKEGEKRPAFPTFVPISCVVYGNQRKGGGEQERGREKKKESILAAILLAGILCTISS